MSETVGAGIAVGRKVRRWSPTTGWSGNDEYVGTVTYITTLVATFQAQRLPFTIEFYDGTPYAKFSVDPAQASDGTQLDQQILDSWGQVTNDLEKDILECDKALTLGPDVIANVIAKAKDAIENPDNYGINQGLLPAGNAQDLYARLVRGQPKSFMVPQYVLRNVKSLPPGVGVSLDYFTLAGAVVESTAKLVQVFAIPTAFLQFEIPNGEWLIKGAACTPEDNGKATFSQEYWHADFWDNFAYNRRIA